MKLCQEIQIIIPIFEKKYPNYNLNVIKYDNNNS